VRGLRGEYAILVVFINNKRYYIPEI